MNGNGIREDVDRRSPHRHRWTAQLLAGLVAIALLVAACGGTSGNSPSGGSGKNDPLAYSRCMRSHGVLNFPDPSTQGGFSIGSESGIDPSSPQFQAAQKACQSLMKPLGGGDEKKFREQALKYAKCMRAHGVSDFPDPNPQGGIELKPGAGSDLDPNSPIFQAAGKVCKKIPGAPGGPGGGTTTINGAS